MAAVLCLAILPAWAVAGTPPPPPKHTTLRDYRHKILSRESAARSVVSAGINTARDVPREWGGGAGGFAKRVASGFAQHVVKGTIEIGVGAIHHEDLSFHPSHLEGTWPRLKYAVKSTFIVPRTDQPGETVAVGRITGNLGAGLISRAWQPASTASVGAGLASGGIGIAADVGVHVAHEFWPRGKPKHRPSPRD
jgi:hypothetical protein